LLFPWCAEQLVVYALTSVVTVPACINETVGNMIIAIAELANCYLYQMHIF